ncbi:MAG: nucleoid-associated protein [Sideroxyarcus sp.]|nr:nucleoid-associated protein [Sideroxyarcus sp.]
MDLTASSVQQLVVHRIGNKLRDEILKLSNSESPVNEELSGLLLGGYLHGISSDKNEFHFHHETDLALNETRFYVGQYFSGKIDFLEASRRLATHLYENSLHPNIRQGDLLVILFEGISFNNRTQRALGIFKSEVLDNYLTVADENGSLSVIPSVGINPNLIDKGALILEHEDIVFALDRFGNKTKFWIDDFLKVKKSADAATCSKMLSFIAGKVAEAIQDPLQRQRYSESIATLCESNDQLDIATLADASRDFVEPEAYEATLSKAHRRFGLSDSENISANSTKISKSLTKRLSKLELRHGISLLLPEGINLSDVQVVEGPDNELIFTIRMRRQHER